MARMRRTDLALTAVAVATGLATLALQRSADAEQWRDVDAFAVVLLLLMTLPVATCRRAPVASALVALTAALGAAALGYPPTSGWFAALLIAAAAVYLTDRRTAVALGAFTLVGDVLASFAAADAAGEPLSAFQLVANVCVIGVPLLLADLLREQQRLLVRVRDQSARLAQLRAAEAGEAAALERVRIARDVHDVVGNDLSAIAVQASAGRTLVDGDPEDARAAFEHIAEMARDALVQTRAAVRGMRAAGADDGPGTPPASPTSTRCSTRCAPPASTCASCTAPTTARWPPTSRRRRSGSSRRRSPTSPATPGRRAPPCRST